MGVSGSFCGLVGSGLCSSFGAVGVEGAGEFLRDGRCGRGLDRGALHEVDELSVTQNSDGGRGGRMAAEVAACLLGSFAVLAREDGDGVIGFGGVLHGETNAGAHLAGGASADRVDNDHRCTGLGYGGIDVGSGAGLGQAGASQLFAHWNYHNLWIHKHLPGTALDDRLARLYGFTPGCASRPNRDARCCSL
jgi:hypothetical protein